MTMLKLSDLSISQLVQKFTEIVLDMDKCIQQDDNDQYAILYKKMTAVESELKARDGDARRELLQLYDHPNIEVRLNSSTSHSSSSTSACAPGVGSN
jgi:hypothetical protein